MASVGMEATKDAEKPETWEDIDAEEQSPVEQVRLTVTTYDDPSLPVWTFRMWFLGILSCALLAFFNSFFSYRKQPLVISMISVQLAALPIGRLLARVLPTTKFWLPGFGSREFSLNPGPFNIKEHVLISIFANAGAAFGSGAAYALDIITIIKAFYHRNISFTAAWFLVITTQVLGYGWAGIMRKYVVEPAEMWWPSSLVQVSVFRALHEKEGSGTSRGKFFFIVLLCSFIWYIVPGYLFKTIANISVICLAFPKSVTAQQIGSGLQGLGIGSFTFDWATIASFLGSPLVSPFFTIFNIFIGYIALMYGILPITYWGMNLYDAKTFPFYSSSLFDAHGQEYNVSAIVNDKFELDEATYEKQGKIYISLFFAVSYALNFATIAASLAHVALFNGKEIYERFRASYKGKTDIHTKLMRRYKDIPSWWFNILTLISLTLSLILCTVMKKEVQLPWWGLIFAAAMAMFFTLPISIITATTNTTPGLNVITEYVYGLIEPGKPIANVCFKTYGYISMAQAVSFLSDFKLGHYMKIPPRSMFMVQILGTLIASTINVATAWWMLTTIKNICDVDALPDNSPWTCPGYHVFYDASVIWGLVGPMRFFGPLGNYSALNWAFLLGAVGPFLVWILYKSFPRQKWLTNVNLPVLFGATSNMPPASSINFNSWLLLGTVFNFYVFRYRKKWWQKYNYVLSAGLDAGVAFMAVALYLVLGLPDINVDWWGAGGDEYCPLAACPTAKGVAVDGCPVF